MKLNNENKLPVYKILDLTFLSPICCPGVDHTLADSRSERRHLFQEHVMKGVEVTEHLLAETPWSLLSLGWKSPVSPLSPGPLMTLERSIKLTLHQLLHWWNKTVTYLIGIKRWLQTAGWKQAELRVGCDYNAAQRCGPLVHRK